MTTQKRCGTCSRGYLKEDGSTISCGAGFEENGIKPIWSERKYSDLAIIALLLGGGQSEGIDCENMDPADGASCLLWKGET